MIKKGTAVGTLESVLQVEQEDSLGPSPVVATMSSGENSSQKSDQLEE